MNDQRRDTGRTGPGDLPTIGTPAVGAELRGGAVADHIAGMIRAAEQDALTLQREVEAESIRRATALRARAEEEADEIRRAAVAEAEAYLEDTRLRIDAFASARVERISDLVDGLTARAEAIQARLGDAVDLENQLRDLVGALTAAARAATAESTRAPLRLPSLGAVEPAGDAADAARPQSPPRIRSVERRPGA